MNALHYWIMTIGVACTGLNISVNGMVIILPTCVGFMLIGLSTWNLKEEDRFFGFLPIPAAILMVLSFPDLFQNAIYRETGKSPLAGFDYWVHYPYVVMYVFLMVTLPIAIARRAAHWGRERLGWMALATAGTILLVEFTGLFVVLHTRTTALLWFAITSTYIAMLMATTIWAARKLP